MFVLKKVLPVSIFTIGCCALAFQATVLHPFHHELDEEFKQIKQLQEQDKKFEEFEEKAFEAVNHVGEQVDELLKLKAKNLVKERLN